MNNQYNDTIGGRLYNYRMSINQMQKDLADVTGIHPATISHMENNRRSPHVDTLKQLAEAWPGVNLHWIITGKGQQSIRER